MRIWIVCVGEPLPSDGKNTRLRRMGNLTALLSQEGHGVDWFSVSFNHYEKKQRCDRDTDVEINPRLIMHLQHTRGYEKNISLGRVLHHIEAGKTIRAKMESLPRPDIIMASMEPLEVSSQVVDYADAHGVPVLIDVRDLWPDMYFDMLPKWAHPAIAPYVWYCRAMLRKTMSRATAIVGLSEGFLEYGLKYAGRARNELDRVFPIAYPNYPYDQYVEKFDENWASHGVKRDDFIIAFLGNFGDTYVFEHIIEASHLLSDEPRVKFVMCGTGIHLDEVRRKSAGNCVFPGWIVKDAIASLSACASLGIAPYFTSITYTKNTPNKVGEYLSASLPMLVGVTGTMQKLVQDHQCGMYYKDGKALAQAIRAYLHDPRLLETHSKNARALYEAQFNGDVVNRRMMAYLLEVAKGDDGLRRPTS